MRIDAAVLRAADAPYTIEPLELADPGPGEVVVRIAGAGICHTDLLGRQPGGFPRPVVLGHEGAGVVEAVGPGVTDVSEGSNVVLSFDSCGACRDCRSARPGSCERMVVLNMAAMAMDGRQRLRDGAGETVHNRWFGQSSFATHALATARNVVPVGDDLPLEKLGPLGCSMQTGAGAVLLSLGVRAGDGIAVFGTGAVGLAAVMAAGIAAATTIIAVDLNEDRLRVAAELGATHTINGADEGLVARIQEITGGGADYAFDTTAVPAVVSNAVASLRTTGVCGLAGVGSQEYRLDPTLMLMGRTVKGIIEGDAVPQTFIPRLVELWRRGRFPFDRLIETYPLEKINEAEADMLAGEIVKPVVLPG
ncbi:NAD(P)-dependent alcohol dehydrogenase [Actinomadura sp. 21ATH]|uniref:NAD(P)-dependent alcohol dehydrogenase n=1 Tax=Actinomadura sp. 21ATH TaxID=1735444 RepID=UPI0035C13344